MVVTLSSLFYLLLCQENLWADADWYLLPCESFFICCNLLIALAILLDGMVG